MGIGQIVKIRKEASGWSNSRLHSIDTGIIAKREYDGEGWWYEVLCNDGENHIIPGCFLELLYENK